MKLLLLLFFYLVPANFDSRCLIFVLCKKRKLRIAQWNDYYIDRLVIILSPLSLHMRPYLVRFPDPLAGTLSWPYHTRSHVMMLLRLYLIVVNSSALTVLFSKPGAETISISAYFPQCPLVPLEIEILWGSLVTFGFNNRLCSHIIGLMGLSMAPSPIE